MTKKKRSFDVGRDYRLTVPASVSADIKSAAKRHGETEHSMLLKCVTIGVAMALAHPGADGSEPSVDSVDSVDTEPSVDAETV